jgi:hypothetical protein
LKPVTNTGGCELPPHTDNQTFPVRAISAFSSGVSTQQLTSWPSHVRRTGNGTTSASKVARRAQG